MPPRPPHLSYTLNPCDTLSLSLSLRAHASFSLCPLTSLTGLSSRTSAQGTAAIAFGGLTARIPEDRATVKPQKKNIVARGNFFSAKKKMSRRTEGLRWTSQVRVARCDQDAGQREDIALLYIVRLLPPHLPLESQSHANGRMSSRTRELIKTAMATTQAAVQDGRCTGGAPGGLAFPINLGCWLRVTTRFVYGAIVCLYSACTVASWEIMEGGLVKLVGG